MPTRAKLIKCSDEYFFRFEQRQKNARTSVHFLHLKGYGNITRYAQRRSRCIAELRDESRALIRDRFYLDFPRRDCKGRVIALTASGEHVADSVFRNLDGITRCQFLCYCVLLSESSLASDSAEQIRGTAAKIPKIPGLADLKSK